jgi:hypothetical protein
MGSGLIQSMALWGQPKKCSDTSSQSNEEQPKPARICPSLPRDAGWHPKPDADRMLGATDLSVILGARSVPLCYQPILTS